MILQGQQGPRLASPLLGQISSNQHNVVNQPQSEMLLNFCARLADLIKCSVPEFREIGFTQSLVRLGCPGTSREIVSLESGAKVLYPCLNSREIGFTRPGFNSSEFSREPHWESWCAGSVLEPVKKIVPLISWIYLVKARPTQPIVFASTY
jgi:hypothetical protein